MKLVDSGMVASLAMETGEGILDHAEVKMGGACGSNRYDTINTPSLVNTNTNGTPSPSLGIDSVGSSPDRRQ